MNDKYGVIRTEKLPSGLVSVEYDNGRESDTLKVFPPRGGLSWATPESDGVFCVVIQPIPDPYFVSDKQYLELIVEFPFSGMAIEKAFNTIRDYVTMFHISEIFTTDRETSEEWHESWWDYQKRHNFRGGDLCPGPYQNNFLYGLSLIQDSLKNYTLDIPKDTLVFEELKRITKPDLFMAPETKFPAVNSLRFVVGSYKADPPREPAVHPKPGGVPGPKQWMAG